VDPAPLAVEPSWIELGGVILLGVAYAVSQRRWPANAPRRLGFVAGLLLVVLVFATPVQTLAVHYLLSAHLFQNVLLAEWAPLLLMVGLSPAAGLDLTRFRTLRALTRPGVALPLWLATYAVWHVPAVYESALRHPGSLLHLEHLCYIFSGLLFWWPVFHHRPWSERSGAKAAYVFAAFLLASPIGLAFAVLPDALYGFYEQAPRVFGMSPLLDQQVAGILMSLSEAAVFFGVFAFMFVRFLREEGEREEARAPSL
jgi:putative membrane protein